MPKRLPSSYTGRRRWTAVDARAVLDALSRSGLSMSAFAAREGLDVQRLRRWTHRLDSGHAAAGKRGEGSKTPVQFVEVPRAPSPAVVEIVLRSGLVVRVSESIELGVLRRLVDALDEDRRSC